MSTAPARATIDDLYRVEGKAELIGGRVVELMAIGLRPGEVATNILFSLRAHARASRTGFATGDGVGYTIPELPSSRESFCPDAAFHAGPPPTNLMKFVDGSPTFAVEVRSENDYGGYAES